MDIDTSVTYPPKENDTSVTYPPKEISTAGAASAVSNLNFFLFLHLTIVYLFMFI